tara:strand:- start:343 stop:759 length:417 start_codon:yes stop_codon:yes gene_type:complete
MADYGADITWESVPDYDGWGWDTYWSCADWMIWYNKLDEHYGASEARLLWKSAWNEQGIWESNYNWCKYDPTFNQFLKDNELGESHLLADTVIDTTEAAGGVLGSLGWVGKNLKWILPSALIIVGLSYVIKVGEIFKK